MSNLIAADFTNGPLSVNPLPKIHVFAIEDGSLIHFAPFADQINVCDTVFANLEVCNSDSYEEYIHGGMVASLLVGGGAHRLHRDYTDCPEIIKYQC